MYPHTFTGVAFSALGRVALWGSGNAGTPPPALTSLNIAVNRPAGGLPPGFDPPGMPPSD